MDVKSILEKCDPRFGECIGLVNVKYNSSKPYKYLCISPEGDLQIIYCGVVFHKFAPNTITDCYVPSCAGRKIEPESLEELDEYIIFYDSDGELSDIAVFLLPCAKSTFLNAIRTKHPCAEISYPVHADYFDIQVAGKHAADFLMFETERHKNLVFCLAAGRSHPDYELKLMLTSQKMQFVGGICWGVGEKKTKLPRVEYERFFDSYCESVEEMRDNLEELGLSADAERVFEKYKLVKAWCLPLIAAADEAYAAGEYRNIIEWIANSKEVPFPPGDDRRSVLSALPFEICTEDAFEYGNFWN